LPVPFRTGSTKERLKTSAEPFSGTQLHAPENVCHNGQLLTNVTP
jgi:hypothetical protein